MKQNFAKFSKSLATTTLMALIVSPFGLIATQFAPVAHAAEPTAKVTIVKYIDGVKATAINASSSDFQMNATYTINGTAGNGQYALSAAGYNGDPTPYQAVTSDLPAGSNYGTTEFIDGTIVGATTATTSPFSLVGYTTGETLAEAAAATPSATEPNFTNIATDKFVIVWNHDNNLVVPVIPVTPAMVKVTIEKFVDGVQATASSSKGTDFQMYAAYNSTTTGQGSGTYALSAAGYNGNPTPYEAKTVDMTSGADYATNEVLDTVNVGDTNATTTLFNLVGYTTGNTLAEAMSATVSTTSPDFANITADKFVIVWNKTHSTVTDGTIDGDVTGGTATGTGTVGILKVTGVTAVKTTAVADGTFASGWKYVFNVTVPTNETHLSMKFSDWASVVGSTTLAVANNMRISSAQADNSGATILLTGANTYATPTLNMSGDLDGALDGKQVQVTIEVAVPSTTVNGSYTTSYGVKTQ